MGTGRKHKFRPDPQTIEAYLQEQIDVLERRVRMLRDRLLTPTIHTFDKDDDYIDPTQGEIFWNFPNQRGYIYHHEYWRPLAPPTYHIKIFADLEPTETGDDKFIFAVSKDMDGFNLYFAEAYVTTSGGSVTVQIRNKTQGQNMLSTPLTIDSGEKHTRYAATPAVINTATSDVAWADEIAIDVVAGGSTQGLGVKLVFNPPIPTN
jgi:hypothetical protein